MRLLAVLARQLLDRLTYANVMSTIAVFTVMGGVAVAAVALPADSVGTPQLRDRAVTGGKLAPRAVDTGQIAPGAVTIGRLSDRVRALVTARPEQGPMGPAGERGPAGEPGARGPGASLLRYSAASSETAPVVVLDMPGLKLRAACAETDGDVAVTLSFTPAEDTTAYDRFSADQGTDPASPGQAFTGNLGIDLPGGAETTVGGPSTSGGSGYARAIATVILSSASRTITLDAAVVVDATHDRCTLDGTAVAASA